MATPRIWIEELADEVRGDSYHQLVKVLRLRSGDSARVVCGDGFEYEVRLCEVGTAHVRLEVLDRRPLLAETRFEVTLYAGMLKGDHMDAVVQKATELGVACIVPLETERSQV